MEDHINKKRSSKKRNKVREYLRVERILPPYGNPLTPEQQKINEQITRNDFSFQEEYVKNKLKDLGLSKYYTGRVAKGLTSEQYIEKEKRKKARSYLRSYNILPSYGDPLTPEQQDIIDQIEENDFSFYEEIKEQNIRKTQYRTEVNPETKYLTTKRQRARSYLRAYGILPPVGESLTPEQQKIDEEISENDFTTYEEMVESNKTRTQNKVPLPKSKQNQKDISGNSPKHVYLRLRTCQILPPIGTPLSEEQEEIIEDIKNNWEDKTKNYFIMKYLHLSTPEGRLLYRAHKTHRANGYNFNLTIDDIIIPKMCPYLEIELTTDPKDYKKPNYATIDRIDNSKGYVKGNIQIISYKANSMKTSTTDEELLNFAVNGLKLIDKMNL